MIMLKKILPYIILAIGVWIIYSLVFTRHELKTDVLNYERMIQELEAKVDSLHSKNDILEFQADSLEIKLNESDTRIKQLNSRIYVIKKQFSEGCSVNNLLTLNNGSQIPSLGLGMWKIEKSILPELVQEAIKIGYRHFDSACDYGNETQVGKGIQSAIKSGYCDREDLWITSKLWNTYHAAEHVRPALQKSLNDLQLDYLDLYLIHFPIATKFVPGPWGRIWPLLNCILAASVPARDPIEVSS